MTARSLLLLLVLPMVLTIGCAAEAPEEEEMGDTESHIEKPVAESREIVNQAISDRLVGQEPTGYLSVVTGDVRGTKKAPKDLGKHVAVINEELRQIYTGVAVVILVTAKIAVCRLFESLSDGAAYLNEEGEWVLRTNEAPDNIPSFCRQVTAPSAKR